MFGQYAGFIIPAYAVSAAVIIGLVVQVNLAHRARLKEIARLEEQGITRRSQRKPKVAAENG